jgi:hypothetical protein
MARSAIDTCSPVAIRWSSSRRSGRGVTSRAVATRPSVVCPIALTVTHDLGALRDDRSIRLATLRMRSRSPTLVPPNFWTRRGKGAGGRSGGGLHGRAAYQAPADAAAIAGRRRGRVRRPGDGPW